MFEHKKESQGVCSRQAVRCFSQANRVWGEGDFRATAMANRAVVVT
jgi:hypothetical protein